MLRLARVHRGIRGLGTRPEALRNFIHVARQPCKLTLARYLFCPDEVAQWIAENLAVSRALPHALPDEAEIALARQRYGETLPAYENAIVRSLNGHCRSYWVTQKTPSRINGLVEYPLGTVVAVIKPPGSDHEFEIKRVGLRGPHPLTARFKRQDETLPWSHRLQGGSAGRMLDAECRAGLRTGELFRAVWGHDPPTSAVLGISAVHMLPGKNGDVNLFSYFTNAGLFGEGFEPMRAEMAHAVESFEGDDPDRRLEGDLGLTVRFFRHVAPRQAFVAGTSSFRLDRLACYLTPKGAGLYFGELGEKYTAADARRFADDLLEEVLGIYTPPREYRGGYGSYVKAALAVPANRRRADQVYLSLLRQVGKFWGAFMGLGAWSTGEIFVTRNVGLRSVWVNGTWTVKLIFLDHDSTFAPWTDCGPFNAAAAVHGQREDARYVQYEGFRPENAKGEMGCLRAIYRPDARTVARGREILRAGHASSFRKTRWKMAHDERLRSMINPEFQRTRAAWERYVRNWMSSVLRRQSITDPPVGAGEQDWLNTIRKYSDFLAEFAHLYGGRYRDFKRSYRQSEAYGASGSRP
jgi:hypothetical protein